MLHPPAVEYFLLVTTQFRRFHPPPTGILPPASPHQTPPPPVWKTLCLGRLHVYRAGKGDDDRTHEDSCYDWI